MRDSSFLRELQRVRELTVRTSEVLGVPYSDVFNEEATIVAVADPEYLGRVKVAYRDGIVTDWVYVLGSGRGQLTAQFIDAKCLVAKASGNAEDAFVLGIYSNSQQGQASSPVQIPVISDQTALFADPQDGGLLCNEGNAGRQYILSGEMGQDLIICMKRNSPQSDGQGQSVWGWKSLTHSRWIEKGFDPGAANDNLASKSYTKNPGVPKCDKAMSGEIHEYSEDRGFRSTFISCVQDENKFHTWKPLSASPTYFKTTLPRCTEAMHGVNVVLDDGGNSEFLVCSRYHGAMKWVKQGSRLPIQFFKEDSPISHTDFLSSFKPIEVLSGPGSKDLTNAILSVPLAYIPATSTDPEFHAALERAFLIPAKYNRAQILKDIAQIFIENKTGKSLSDIVSVLSQDNVTPEQVSPTLLDVSSFLIEGARDNNLSQALQDVGQKVLGDAISGLSDESGSVYMSYLASGAIGALDTAVGLGLDQLGDEGPLKAVLSPTLSVGISLLKNQPKTFQNILNAAIDGGLADTIQGIVKAAGPDALRAIGDFTGLTPVVDMFKGFANLDIVKKLGPGVPKLATTALALLGQHVQFKNYLGVGGIGFDAVKALTGLNPVTTILKGLGGLFGFGGGKRDCPCDPKCRKTSHAKDSDGNNLLEKCGALPSNTANSYGSLPLENNKGPVALLNGLSNTDIGKPLSIPTNPFLLSELVKKIPKLNDLAKSVWNGRFADQTEQHLEQAYTAEAVQNSLKQTANNLTKLDSINRKVLDATYRLIQTYLFKGGRGRSNKGIIPQLIEAVRANSESIKDIHAFVKALDNVKTGPSVGVRPTKAITTSIANISNLSLLAEVSRKEALRILSSGLVPADREWRELHKDDSSINLSSIGLGTLGQNLPTPFPTLGTYFNEDRVLNLSLAALEDGTEDTPLAQTMSENNLNQAPDLVNEQTTANQRKADCG